MAHDLVDEAAHAARAGTESPVMRIWRTAAHFSDPPIPQWIDDLWTRHGGFSVQGSEGFKREAQALLWFVTEFLKGRPYRFALPPELAGWLNQTELDLTDKFAQRPGLEGPVSCHQVKPVSRLMYSAWEQHGRPYRIDRADGYYEFLAWYVLSVMPTWNLPGALLPTPVIDLLNAPAAGDDVPLTVGMLMHLKAAYPEEFQGLQTAPRETVLALSFRAIREFLAKGDPRLIPAAVSAFWRHRPLSKGLVTAFEYLEARATEGVVRDGASAEVFSEAEVRDWFHTEIAWRFRGAHLMSGVPSLPTSLTEDAVPPVHDTAVVIYRDHETVAGLSRAGAITRDALLASGIPTFDVHFALRRERLSEEAEQNRGVWINARRKLHLLNLNPEIVPECCHCNLQRIGRDDYIIGQFYWELSRTSKTHEAGLALVDEIWTASRYLTGIYAAETSKTVITMGQAIVAREPTAPLSRHNFNFSDDAYLFLASFDATSIVERKNPLGTVTAFQEAFSRGDERAGLIIKTRNAAELRSEREKAHWASTLKRVRKDRRIRIIDYTMSEDELAALYRMCDCFVSLHRSEGFGFGPAEAMAHGKPAIVTNYSGVCDFCTATTAKLVDYELIRVQGDQYPYLDPDRVYEWADPKLESAAECMRELAGDREQSRRLGRAAQAFVSQTFSVEALQRRYVERLQQLGFSAAVRETEPADFEC